MRPKRDGARTRNLPKYEESARVFQRNGKFYEPGDTFVEPDLARVRLNEFRAEWREGVLREGETAKKLVEAEAKNGGLITRFPI